MTQRLHRIVAILAIHGARGARHFNTIIRPSIHFTTGTMTGGTQVLTVRHRNVSTPSGPNASPGHTLMQRPHPVQDGTSFLPAYLSPCRDSWTRRPVTTPLSNSRGPNRGLKRTVFLPGNPSPPAAATCFSRTTPCTLPSAILTGRYRGTGRAGTCSASKRAASWTAVVSSPSAIRSIPLVFSFCGIRYTGTGTSFPKTITDWAPGKNCTTEDLSSSAKLSRLTSEKTSIPCSRKNDSRSNPILLFDLWSFLIDESIVMGIPSLLFPFLYELREKDRAVLGGYHRNIFCTALRRNVQIS